MPIIKREKYIDSDGQELECFTWSGGTKVWYQEGLRHRLDGPAVTYPSGYKAWFNDGLLHREDGPAVVHPDDTEEYYLEGETVSKREIDLIWLKKQVEE